MIQSGELCSPLAERRNAVKFCTLFLNLKIVLNMFFFVCVKRIGKPGFKKKVKN